MKVLAIGDNQSFLNLLRSRLKKRGFVVDGADTLENGTTLAFRGGYDAILLDPALRDGNGKRLVDRLRRASNAVPILIISARGTIGDRVTLLNSGADDYLVRPLDFHELVSRIHAVVRRSGDLRRAPQAKLIFADITFDTYDRRTTVNGRPIKLRRRETMLLEVLLRGAGVAVHREALMLSLYSIDDEIGSNVLTVHVHHLRRRLAEVGARATIATVYGFGYQLRE